MYDDFPKSPTMKKLVVILVLVIVIGGGLLWFYKGYKPEEAPPKVLPTHIQDTDLPTPTPTPTI